VNLRDDSQLLSIRILIFSIGYHVPLQPSSGQTNEAGLERYYRALETIFCRDNAKIESIPFRCLFRRDVDAAHPDDLELQAYVVTKFSTGAVRHIQMGWHLYLLGSAAVTLSEQDTIQANVSGGIIGFSTPKPEPLEIVTPPDSIAQRAARVSTAK
jgi:hypothetical protein